LRLAEISAARCADLERIEYTDDAGAAASGWFLTVTNKSDKVRQVPVPASLIDELAPASSWAPGARSPLPCFGVDMVLQQDVVWSQS
jgi:hypothetical protein